MHKFLPPGHASSRHDFESIEIRQRTLKLWPKPTTWRPNTSEVDRDRSPGSSPTGGEDRSCRPERSGLGEEARDWTLRSLIRGAPWGKQEVERGHTANRSKEPGGLEGERGGGPKPKLKRGEKV